MCEEPLSRPGSPAQGCPDISLKRPVGEDMMKNDQHDSAHAVLVRLFCCAGIVPLNDHKCLALALVEEGISDEVVLRIVLDGDKTLLPCIGMKKGQQSCLLRYLNRASAACDVSSASNIDPETAAIINLKSFFAAAGVVPIAHYESIAQRLIEQGVADEISMRDSIRASSLDLRKAVVKMGQAVTILRALEPLENEAWITNQLQLHSGNSQGEFSSILRLGATAFTENSAAECDDGENSEVFMCDQNQRPQEEEAGCISEFAQVLSRDLDLVSENSQLVQFDPEIAFDPENRD